MVAAFFYYVGGTLCVEKGGGVTGIGGCLCALERNCHGAIFCFGYLSLTGLFASVYYVSTVRITGRLACGIPGGGSLRNHCFWNFLQCFILSFAEKGNIFWPLYTHTKLCSGGKKGVRGDLFLKYWGLFNKECRRIIKVSSNFIFQKSLSHFAAVNMGRSVGSNFCKVDFQQSPTPLTHCFTSACCPAAPAWWRGSCAA